MILTQQYPYSLTMQVGHVHLAWSRNKGIVYINGVTSAAILTTSMGSSQIFANRLHSDKEQCRMGIVTLKPSVRLWCCVAIITG